MRILSLLFCFCLFVSFKSFALIGEESALMFELVTTTAQQLNELEKIVSNAEKYTLKMREYNELVQDEYFKAERVATLAEEVTARKDVQNLGDLNRALRGLKLSMSDLQVLMKEYGAIKDDEIKTKKEVAVEKNLIDRQMPRAKKQVDSSLNASTAARSNQLTAQNTALIHETQLNMQKTQLDLLENTATTNRLLAEELEEKRVEEIKRQKAYGIKSKGEK